MNIQETPLEGVFIMDTDPAFDARGSFEHLWDADAFLTQRIPFNALYTAFSRNAKRGTLRGLHYQMPPAQEKKLIYCTRGSLFDVALDCRKESPTYKKWFSLELSSQKPQLLYLSPGIAHGFQTLEDDTDVLYHLDTPYDPRLSTGIRWDDPTLALPWPLSPTVISERDRTFPYLAERLL